ncbi:hypothetical protein VTJ49DRAFT_6178 [Mycothermus thermophilus]|uniref:F-box domain-containing protein n=1 Tax=Humicola insolens TaxID=85995 RepID=A0ABR3VK95_HUMIN
MFTKFVGQFATQGLPPNVETDGNGYPDIEKTIINGRHLMEHRQFTEALRVLIKAVNMCPCHPHGAAPSRHPKDKSCHISQFLKALENPNLDILYEVAQAPCPCGYIWPSCTRPQHAVALDALAECLDKAGQHVSAFSTALSIVRLDPTSAVGYCRAALMIKGVFKKPSEADANPATPALLSILLGPATNPPYHMKLRRLLVRFLDRALNTTMRHRRNPKGKYDVILQRMAYILKLDVGKRDPGRMLPPELLHMVFSHLSVSDLIQCLRVNKQWNRTIVSNALLWSDLTLTRPRNPGRSFGAFLQRHQYHIRAFTIQDTAHFQMTYKKLRTLLYALPQLQRLSLDCRNTKAEAFYAGLDPTGDITLIKDPPIRARVSCLSLASVPAPQVLRDLVRLSSETLQVLEVAHCQTQVDGAFESLLLPKLKKLRIVGLWKNSPQVSRTSGTDIELVRIARATPNLEELFLDGLVLTCPGGQASSNMPSWPSLWRLVLGRSAAMPRFFPPRPISHLYLPLWASKLRSLELLTTDEVLAYIALSSKPPDTLILPDENEILPPSALAYEIRHHQHLTNLEVFRCASFLSPEILRRVLGPAATRGTLQVLELTASRFSSNSDFTSSMFGMDTSADLNPVKDLPYLRPDKIHTLGLRSFNYHQDQSRTSSAFDGQPFLDWIMRFPNLHTVAVYPGQWADVDILLAQVILHPGVKVIHQDSLTGVAWDKARQLAEQEGVDLRHSPGYMPVAWDGAEVGEEPTKKKSSQAQQVSAMGNRPEKKGISFAPGE